MVETTTKPTFTEVEAWQRPTKPIAEPIAELVSETKDVSTQPKTLTRTKTATPRTYKWKGNKKQRLAMDSWLNPGSATFGNAYQSFKNAGFSETYSRNVINLAPKWLSEYIDKADFSDEHIKQGVQRLATGAPNSKSPDDTRLKAYELLAKITGLLEGRNTTVTVVTPILGGQSTETIKADVIDQ